MANLESVVENQRSGKFRSINKQPQHLTLPACGESKRIPTPTQPSNIQTSPTNPPPIPPPIADRYPDPDPPAPSVIFVGAGDAGYCRPNSRIVEATARLLRGFPSAMKFVVGDIIYLPDTLERCFDPSWGQNTPIQEIW